MTKPRLILAALAAAFAFVLVTATPASAHARLLSSDPKDGAALATAPKQAVLEFSERLDAKSTQIAVTDSSGGVVPSSPFTVDGQKLTQPLSLTVAGTYTIGYRLVSEDGHRVDGKLTFSVQTGTTPSEAASAGTSPSGTVPSPLKSEVKSTADQIAETSGTTIWWIAGAVALAVGLFVAVSAMRKRNARRP
ncbi:copper resistance CopC family protein [Actinorhabdospora filicis]|uniref:copper resistance CopC family protein n=1 Tax=Actinorhabdospora filicis TaxID=1785913 RepID=UPI0025526783|nr:copper resistance CopC family protein [Actinorhabdospora filicis]